jgi:limonene-1,2-epoxide hydrolase
MHLYSQTTRRLALWGAAGATLGGCAGFSAGAEDAASPDWLALIDRLFAVYAASDLAAFEALIADDISFIDPTFHLRANGKVEMMAIARGLAGYRDVRFERLNTINAGAWVITQQIISANAPNSGGEMRALRVEGCSLFQILDGKIAVWNDYYDVLTFREQMRG